MDAARLLFPALRWDPRRGFDQAAPTIARALALGVGGFIVFGGPASEVAGLTAELRARSRRPLLIGADLERGAGQQFAGATSLPPAAAFGHLGDPALSRRAGQLTAREARALGIDWIYAPVADLAVEPANPIVGARAYGADPALVAAHVAAWIEGCRAGGALACAKHFPGHGRTVADSHLGLPVVGADRAALEADLAPFRAAVACGVDSVMTAHVAFPALDPAGAPATRSAPIVDGLLRRDLGHRGLVVTDALLMAGVLGADGDEGRAAVAALAAGCDALLYPAGFEAVASAVSAAAGRSLAPARLAAATARVEAAAGVAARRPAAAHRGAGGPADGPGWGRPEDRHWAVDVAVRALQPVRGRPVAAREMALVTVDDDLGGPFPPPSRDGFARALGAAGIRVHGAPTGPARPTLVAVYADVRGWKGRPGISGSARERVGRVVADRAATVVLFGHPRLAGELPGDTVLAAWGGETCMQEAVARWLAERA